MLRCEQVIGICVTLFLLGFEHLLGTCETLMLLCFEHVLGTCDTLLVLDCVCALWFSHRSSLMKTLARWPTNAAKEEQTTIFARKQTDIAIFEKRC